MAWDFTPGESDNALYWHKLDDMNNEELLEEYRELMRSRGEGADAGYNLQMCFDIIRTAFEMKHLPFPEVPEDNKIFEYIKQINTPDSKGIIGYGYDFYKHILYIRYRSNNRVYAFSGVPLERYKIFESSKSKGKEATLIRKEYGNKK